MGRWNVVLFCNVFVSLKNFQNEKFKNLMFLSFLLGHHRENRISIFFFLRYYRGNMSLCYTVYIEYHEKEAQGEHCNQSFI